MSVRGVAQLLRRHRIRLGLTQAELAGRTTMSQQHLSLVERGRIEPSWGTLQRLLEALGLELELRSMAGSRPAPDPRARLDLPGGDLVEQGLADLSAGLETVEALLVSIGEPRLRRSGLEAPVFIPDPELRLYERLCRDSSPDEAHGRYNALIRRLVSYERAAECAS